VHGAVVLGNATWVPGGVTALRARSIQLRWSTVRSIALMSPPVFVKTVATRLS
jgi:hypothetical protein